MSKSSSAESRAMSCAVSCLPSAIELFSPSHSPPSSPLLALPPTERHPPRFSTISTGQGSSSRLQGPYLLPVARTMLTISAGQAGLRRLPSPSSTRQPQEARRKGCDLRQACTTGRQPPQTPTLAAIDGRRTSRSTMRWPSSAECAWSSVLLCPRSMC